MKIYKTKEITGVLARKYDYINRVLASFAEIYNYDLIETSLIEENKLYENKNLINLENGYCIRPEGYQSKIHAYYKNHLNESENNNKLYYKEKIYSDSEKTEYGFLYLNKNKNLMISELISLGIRILESFGIKDLKVILNEKTNEELKSYLDYLDIDYEISKLNSDFSDIYFQIKKEIEEEDGIILLDGGVINTSKIIDNLLPVALIHGDVENIVRIADILGLDIENKKSLEILIKYQTEEELLYSLYLTQELRLNGFKTELTAIKDNISIYNPKYLIEVKENLIKENKVSVMDYLTKDAEEIKEIDLVSHLDMNI